MRWPFNESALKRLHWEVGRGFGSTLASAGSDVPGIGSGRAGPGSGRVGPGCGRAGASGRVGSGSGRGVCDFEKDKY